jgi:hypothetical protein
MKGVLSLRLVTLPPHGPKKLRGPCGDGEGGERTDARAIQKTKEKKTIVMAVIDGALK